MDLKGLLLLMAIVLLSCDMKIVSVQSLSIFQTNSHSTEKQFYDTINLLLNPIITDNSNIITLSSPDNDVKFYLYTISNRKNAYLLKINDIDNLNLSPFNDKIPTKIIIHGWTDNGTDSWIKNFSNNYFIIGNYNIIAVDWYPLSASEYKTAVKLTRPIGEYIGELLKYLNVNANVLLSDIHILGHSLGAHIAGFAGAKLSGAIGRITGMDPAGPLYEVPILKEPNDRLDSTDALFVDIIHTCAGSAGFTRAIGHVDFYPNGGSFKQPGCLSIESIRCSHYKSYIYMIDSIIYPDEFVAFKCDSWNNYKSGKCLDNIGIMGEHVSYNLRGTYYLETNSVSPYGKG